MKGGENKLILGSCRVGLDYHEVGFTDDWIGSSGSECWGDFTLVMIQIE